MKTMPKERTESKYLACLSWVALVSTASLIVVLFALTWSLHRLTILPATPPWPEYQGLSLAAAYRRLVYASFVNPFWILAIIGVAVVWLQALRRGPGAKRLALVISLILVYRWLQLNLVLLLAFSRFRY